eukprot:TRINITY_DN24797_c0_g1_i4.p1 TRINITY_DN24797_c0_g1~~TRINITY_DN24797_c0_g1_i4.p1  ORF type:complete len:211 (-),score=25.38 TRINITY_DN24797_c0_g1_i4:141-773(-)
MKGRTKTIKSNKNSVCDELDHCEISATTERQYYKPKQENFGLLNTHLKLCLPAELGKPQSQSRTNELLKCKHLTGSNPQSTISERDIFCGKDSEIMYSGLLHEDDYKERSLSEINPNTGSASNSVCTNTLCYDRPKKSLRQSKRKSNTENVEINIGVMELTAGTQIYNNPSEFLLRVFQEHVQEARKLQNDLIVNKTQYEKGKELSLIHI